VRKDRCQAENIGLGLGLVLVSGLVLGLGLVLWSECINSKALSSKGREKGSLSG
jgi:hypothetical protein